MSFEIPELEIEQTKIDRANAYQQLKGLRGQLLQSATTFESNFQRVKGGVSVEAQAVMDINKSEMVQALRAALGV
jgi:hypothetical protein